MIAKSSWFSVRKYGGWGLTPNCPQGWLYIIIAIIPVILIKNNYFVAIWSLLLALDLIHVFFNLKKDERETLHEAISDRNALWFMILALVIGSLIKQTIDPIILVALLGASLVKSITSFYLRDK
jgi:4-hydroxybenzoate polyprenyltransferase